VPRLGRGQQGAPCHQPQGALAQLLLGGAASAPAAPNTAPGCRLNATYRLVGQVLIIVLTHGQENAFASLNVVNAVTRLLVVECRAVDITPGTIEKRYAQVRARQRARGGAGGA
jgi:hypothetical protein